MMYIITSFFIIDFVELETVFYTFSLDGFNLMKGFASFEEAIQAENESLSKKVGGKCSFLLFLPNLSQIGIFFLQT